MDLNPVILAIPLYFLLIGMELLVQYFSKEKLYRLNDAFTNISCGITQQVTDVFLKVGLLGIYAMLYQHFAILSFPPTILNSLLLFVLVDFCYYWAHRMSHEVNLFWGGHVVHHQSEDYNFSVALRQGSFQSIWTAAFYWPLALIGFETMQFLFISALVTIYQFWIHTEKIGKLGPLEWVLNTPSHHRVHHGRDPKYIDKNHAGVFIIWDRMFGTFQEEEEKPTYGITTPVNSWNPVWVNLQHYQWIWQQLKKTHGWKERIRTLFYKPGWQPDYLGGYMAPPAIDKSSYIKFDIPLPKILGWYVLVQYLFTLGGAAYFLFQIGNWDLWQKVLGAGFIILSVYSIGYLLEHRTKAFQLEAFRLFCLGTGCLLLSLMEEKLQVLGVAGSFLVIMTYVWLLFIRKRISQLATVSQGEAGLQVSLKNAHD
ncbi:sterol desaturase family protein [Nafulsella turpanensis]|uniref:sterol desaturase family protein n=1 Tax=Nafulsella turpanensis TaxID=1265690 RepID=UPI000348D32A|nr:sterol desaturase family protein [Nafulsella turpanensis]